MKVVPLLAVLLAMTGCASITGSKMQPVSIQTTANAVEVTGVSCTLVNDAGKWFVTSPGSVTIQKSTGDLAISCAKNELIGNAIAVSKSNTAVWGNIIFGGGIGYIVDRSTGAGFDYPQAITIPLRQLGSNEPLPAAPVASGAPGMQ